MTSPPAMLEVRYRYVSVARQTVAAMAAISRRIRGGSVAISISLTVIAADSAVPAMATIITSAMNRRRAGTASTRSARSAYGGLQSDSQATAATIAAAWRGVGTLDVTIALSRRAEATNAVTMVIASADHDPKRLS